MPYIKETVFAGKTREVRKFYSCPGAGRRKGSFPQGKTTEAQARANQERAERELRQLLNHNFSPGDYHAVLTYRRENRPDPKEARRQAERFLCRYRYWCRKRGLPAKYILVTEYKKTAIHHHIVLPNIGSRALQGLWPLGRVLISPLDDSGQWRKLAAYLIKETSKSFSQPGRIYGKRWCASRELEKPPRKRETVRARRWAEQPRPPKGWYLEKDSLYNGEDPVTGAYLQAYCLIRLDGPGKGG